MKRIVLKPVIEGYATDYLVDIRTLTNKPEDRLKSLRDQLSGDYNAYVNTIIQNYDDIITAKPEDLKGKIVSLFSAYSSTVDKSSFHTICYTKQDGTIGSVTKKFYILLTDALGYDDVQEKVFPKYIKKMGIKSCVYCNAQYAVAAKKGITDNGKAFRSTYTIDHYLPKSDYPYLATSFFNLYPACSTCNQIKNKKDPLFELYMKPTDPVVLRNPFVFRLDKQSFVKYSMTGNAEELIVKFETRNGLPIKTVDAAKYENYFHIVKLYANYCDTVEEVIWKYRVYNKAGRQALMDGFADVLPYKSDWNRFVLGNYDQEKDILKRPLAKLVQDVARQLGLI
ncbi:MAG: hypothetical protein J6Y78_11595 [Paludibacteraceae bacterium]|nr:hypothetical protein [Paludibacteraceae bacterium]